MHVGSVKHVGHEVGVTPCQLVHWSGLGQTCLPLGGRAREPSKRQGDLELHARSVPAPQVTRRERQRLGQLPSCREQSFRPQVITFIDPGECPTHEQGRDGVGTLEVWDSVSSVRPWVMLEAEPRALLGDESRELVEFASVGEQPTLHAVLIVRHDGRAREPVAHVAPPVVDVWNVAVREALGLNLKGQVEARLSRQSLNRRGLGGLLPALRWRSIDINRAEFLLEGRERSAEANGAGRVEENPEEERGPADLGEAKGPLAQLARLLRTRHAAALSSSQNETRRAP